MQNPHKVRPRLSILRRTWIAALLALIAPTAGAPLVIAYADNRSHEEALAAFRSGEIVSLQDVLREIERRFIGQVLEVELDRDRERVGHTWVYEIKLLSPEGNVFNIEMDAKTKEIFKVEGPAVERPAGPR
jgi:hypothetical protein